MTGLFVRLPFCLQFCLQFSVGVKEVRCTPFRDLILDKATYAIPSTNTLSERSIIAQSSERP